MMVIICFVSYCICFLLLLRMVFWWTFVFFFKCLLGCIIFMQVDLSPYYHRNRRCVYYSRKVFLCFILTFNLDWTYINLAFVFTPAPNCLVVLFSLNSKLLGALVLSGSWSAWLQRFLTFFILTVMPIVGCLTCDPRYRLAIQKRW